MLGEAQELAGFQADALVSYETFLALVGDDVAEWTVVKVQELQAQVEALLPVADTAV